MLNRSVAAPSHGQNHLLFRERQRNQQEGRENIFFLSTEDSINIREVKNDQVFSTSPINQICLTQTTFSGFKRRFRTTLAVHMVPVQKRSSTQLFRGDHEDAQIARATLQLWRKAEKVRFVQSGEDYEETSFCPSSTWWEFINRGEPTFYAVW